MAHGVSRPCLPKHGSLHDHIHQHYSKVMSKQVTMQHIAEAVGVSKNTVSLALRNDPQIPVSTRRRIEKAAGRLGYRRDPVVGQLMARMRSRKRGPQEALALFNANQDRDAFTRHPTIPTYVEGCRRRAEHLGYALNEFWLHDPELKGDRLAGILKSRSIRGAMFVGLMKENRLPPRFERIWSEYPCVVTGVRTRDPALSFAYRPPYHRPSRFRKSPRPRLPPSRSRARRGHRLLGGGTFHRRLPHRPANAARPPPTPALPCGSKSQPKPLRLRAVVRAVPSGLTLHALQRGPRLGPALCYGQATCGFPVTNSFDPLRANGLLVYPD